MVSVESAAAIYEELSAFHAFVSSRQLDESLDGQVFLERDARLAADRTAPPFGRENALGVQKRHQVEALNMLAVGAPHWTVN